MHSLYCVYIMYSLICNILILYNFKSDCRKCSDGLLCALAGAQGTPHRKDQEAATRSDQGQSGYRERGVEAPFHASFESLAERRRIRLERDGPRLERVHSPPAFHPACPPDSDARSNRGPATRHHHPNSWSAPPRSIRTDNSIQ